MIKEGGISLADLEEPQVVETPTPEVQPKAEETPPPAPKEEPVAKTPPETPPQETPPVEAPPSEPPKVDDPASIQQSGENVAFVETLNKFLNKEFESEEQAKEALTQPSMKTEYEEAQQKLAELQSKYDVLTEQLDPMSYFSSEEAMKLEAFKKQYPKKDASIAQKIFSQEDLSAVSDLDMVKMGRKFSNPKLPGTEKDLEDALALEFGEEAETPVEEWSKAAQIRMATVAGEYRDQFETMKQGVKLPEVVNIEELRNQRQKASEEQKAQITEAWNKHSKEIANDTKVLKVPVGTPKEGEEQKFFEWDLGKPPQAEADHLAKSYATVGAPMNDETKAAFQRSLQMSLLEANLPQILQKYGDDLEARKEEAHLKETHNPEPLTDSQRPKEGTVDEQLRERTGWAIGGMGSSIRSNPLFKTKPNE